MIKKLLCALSITLLLCIPVFSEQVIYNPNTKIYHSVNCPSAIRCKTCIKIDKSQAIKKGGRPCKKCGG